MPITITITGEPHEIGESLAYLSRLTPDAETEVRLAAADDGPTVLTVEDVKAGALDDATPPDTDATGLPWDERIHSAGKTLNADGTWRLRRNVDDAVRQAVEAELRGTLEPEPEPEPEPVAAVAPPPPPPPAPPAAPVADEKPAPAASQPEMTFAELVKLVADGVNSGKWAQSAVLKTVAEVGTANGVEGLTLPGLMQHKELISAVYEALNV